MLNYKNKVDLLSFLVPPHSEGVVSKIRTKNKQREERRKKNNIFATDCENILFSLKNYNFQYNGLETNVGENILFIVGLPRSGKTSIEKTLESTGQFDCFDEIYSIGYMLDKLTGPDKVEYKYPEYLPKMNDCIFPDMANDFMDRLNKKVGKTNKIITNTMPSNFLYIPLIKKMLPKAKIIWCHRNPLLHLVSLFCKDFKQDYWSFTDDADELKKAYSLYMDVYYFYKDNISEGFLDIDFENFIDNPTKEIERIFHFIGIKNEHNNIKEAIFENKNYLDVLNFENKRLKNYLPYFPEFINNQ